jgi:TolA-binding protein
MEPARRSETTAGILLAIGIACMAFTGCSKHDENSPERARAAKEQFDTITRNFHVPSANTNEAERLRLQNEAAARYADLVKRFPEQSNLCAQALRSLGNIHAAQTNVDAAVKDFAAVGQRYATQEWELLQAWKSAADLLWDAGRTNEAQVYYSNVVARFDTADAPAIYKAVVRGSKARLRK